MREKIRIVATEGPEHCYYTTKNKRTKPDKLELKKYHPVLRKHVLYRESKMPSHSKK